MLNMLIKINESLELCDKFLTYILGLAIKNFRSQYFFFNILCSIKNIHRYFNCYRILLCVEFL